jgi:siroheme synthase
MPTQRSVRTTLAALPRTLTEENIRPPSVWVVGEVVALGADGPPSDDED